MGQKPNILHPFIEVTNQGEIQKSVLNATPEIVYSPETCALEHASINGPLFPTIAKKKKNSMFPTGEEQTPKREKGGIVGTMGFDPTSPRKRPKHIKAQKRPKHPYMNRDPGLNSGLWASTPSSNRLPSLKQWSASDFPADSLTIEEHILLQTTYETTPKKITNL